MSEETDSSPEAEQPGLAATPRVSKRVYLMPPARWKSGRSGAQVEATDWSTIVQAPSAWSPKWVKPSLTPGTGLSRLKWMALRPQAVSYVAGIRAVTRRALVSTRVPHAMRDLRDRALRETSAVWDHTHRRSVVAAVSCCAIFCVIAVPLLTGVAHSEPKIETLPVSDLSSYTPDTGATLQVAVPGSSLDRTRVNGAPVVSFEAGLRENSAIDSTGFVLADFKSLKTPASGRRGSRFIDMTVPVTPDAVSTGSGIAPIRSAETFSSVQRVVESLHVSELGLLLAPDASIDPIESSTVPIAINRPAMSSVPPIAQFILPVLTDLPSATQPVRRSRAVVAMTLISDVSTMDLMMPIAEPDLDIASHESVWAQVGKQFSIDPLLLYSIALVESKSLHPNGQVAPTPWMFRVSDRLVTGERHHVQMQIAMAGQLNSAVQDVGIMQVYYPMHRNAARDPLTLLDPRTNITVAAKILQDGMHRTRDPVMGIGYYHSGTPSLALNYGTAVMIVYQRLKGVYRQARNSQVVARQAAHAPLRLASGVNEQPAHIGKAKAGY